MSPFSKIFARCLAISLSMSPPPVDFYQRYFLSERNGAWPVMVVALCSQIKYYPNEINHCCYKVHRQYRISKTNISFPGN